MLEVEAQQGVVWIVGPGIIRRDDWRRTGQHLFKPIAKQIVHDCEVTGVFMCGPFAGCRAPLQECRWNFANERRYDVMLDIIGNRSWRDCGRALKPGGTFVLAGGDWHNRWLGPLPRLASLRLLSMAGGPRLANYTTRLNRGDLSFLAELMDAGALTPVVDRRYAMDEAVDALLHLGTGHARGKVVITVS